MISVQCLPLSYMIKCFAASKLVLNLDKTIVMKFITENWSHSALRIGHKEKYIEKAVNTEFLVLPINPLNAEFNPICHKLALLGATYKQGVPGGMCQTSGGCSLC